MRSEKEALYRPDISPFFLSLSPAADPEFQY